jgi:hypothetical protein
MTHREEIDRHIRDCLPPDFADVLIHVRPGAENGYPGLAAISRLLHSGEATIEAEPDGFVLVIYPLKSSTE